MVATNYPFLYFARWHDARRESDLLAWRLYQTRFRNSELMEQFAKEMDDIYRKMEMMQSLAHDAWTLASSIEGPVADEIMTKLSPMLSPVLLASKSPLAS